MHDMKLTHTDLKPENMLFKYKLLPSIEPNDGQEADISLIDFGSATFEHEVRYNWNVKRVINKIFKHQVETGHHKFPSYLE